MQERRQHSRIPITTKITFRDGNKEQVLFSEDISEGGTFLKSDQPPFVGTQLDLQISLPMIDQLIEVKGEVIWRLEGTGCGIRFSRITQAQRKLIRQFIHEQTVLAADKLAE